METYGGLLSPPDDNNVLANRLFKDKQNGINTKTTG